MGTQGKKPRSLAGRRFLLPSARVVKPLPENRFDIKIDNNQIFFKLLTPGDPLTVLIEHKAVAIEYQFVLSADKIVVSNDDSVIRRARREHPFSPQTLSGVIRRRGDIDDDFGSSRQRLLEDRAIRVPDVFADTDADSCPAHLQDGPPAARLKIPEFIEYSVIRKINLVICRDEIAILGDCRRVKNVIPPVDESDDRGNVPGPAHDFIQCCKVGIDELRLQQQVFRWIAGKGEFRKCNNVGAGISRTIRPPKRMRARSQASGISGNSEVKSRTAAPAAASSRSRA